MRAAQISIVILLTNGLPEKNQRVTMGSSVRSARFIVNDALDDSSSVRSAMSTLRPYGTCRLPLIKNGRERISLRPIRSRPERLPLETESRLQFDDAARQAVGGATEVDVIDV